MLEFKFSVISFDILQKELNKFFNSEVCVTKDKHIFDIKNNKIHDNYIVERDKDGGYTFYLDGNERNVAQLIYEKDRDYKSAREKLYFTIDDVKGYITYDPINREFDWNDIENQSSLLISYENIFNYRYKLHDICDEVLKRFSNKEFDYIKTVKDMIKESEYTIIRKNFPDEFYVSITCLRKTIEIKQINSFLKIVDSVI